MTRVITFDPSCRSTRWLVRGEESTFLRERRVTDVESRGYGNLRRYLNIYNRLNNRETVFPLVYRIPAISLRTSPPVLRIRLISRNLGILGKLFFSRCRAIENSSLRRLKSRQLSVFLAVERRDLPRRVVGVESIRRFGRDER